MYQSHAYFSGYEPTFKDSFTCELTLRVILASNSSLKNLLASAYVHHHAGFLYLHTTSGIYSHAQDGASISSGALLTGIEWYFVC